MSKTVAITVASAQRKTAKGKRLVESQQQNRATQEEKEKKAEKRRAQRHAREIYNTEVSKAIKKAADAGKESTSIIIAQWADRITSYHSIKVNHLANLLKKDGYTTESRTRTMEPFGSDPLFPNTVYDLYLDVSWKK